MPIKSTKTTKKSDLKTSKVVEQKDSKKKDSTKKVVVKRRKVELVPTRASAVAIASQANRAKKNALIEKMASSPNIPSKKMGASSDTKIPLWVRIFFGCSLLLFCVSFYKAVIYPQLDRATVDTDSQEMFVDYNSDIQNDVDYGDNGEVDLGYAQEDSQSYDNSEALKVPATSTEVIEEFFARLSDRNYNEAFELMVPSLRSYPDIRDHFTSFRMNPFLDGIEGGSLMPVNIRYVESPAYGRDVYNFDLSYVMKLDQARYEETWEFTINTAGDEPKIASVRCVTSRCSYHPIFWPENFGLMR